MKNIIIFAILITAACFDTAPNAMVGNSKIGKLEGNKAMEKADSVVVDAIKSWPFSKTSKFPQEEWDRQSKAAAQKILDLIWAQKPDFGIGELIADYVKNTGKHHSNVKDATDHTGILSTLQSMALKNRAQEKKPEEKAKDISLKKGAMINELIDEQGPKDTDSGIYKKTTDVKKGQILPTVKPLRRR
jgi:hypothetical protein